MTSLRRGALFVILGNGLFIGLWALSAPRNFYDSFPGAGRVWVALDGPFNEHLIRDVGALNLALAFVAGFALATRSVQVAQAAGGAALIFGVPHLLYHLLHLDPYQTDDAVGIVFGLVFAVAAGIVAVLPDRPAADAPTPHPAT